VPVRSVVGRDIQRGWLGTLLLTFPKTTITQICYPGEPGAAAGRVELVQKYKKSVECGQKRGQFPFPWEEAERRTIHATCDPCLDSRWPGWAGQGRPTDGGEQVLPCGTGECILAEERKTLNPAHLAGREICSFSLQQILLHADDSSTGSISFRVVSQHCSWWCSCTTSLIAWSVFLDSELSRAN
jgi:hypothetical protein